MSTTPTLVDSPASASHQTPQALTTPNPSEVKGELYANRLQHHIEKRSGKYLRDEEGKLFVFMGGRSIPINTEDIDFSSLLLKVCNVTTVALEGRIGVRRLEILANEKCSSIRERYFSACSDDESRIFIPTGDEKLLEISEHAIELVSNVTNDAHLWLRHPDKSPFAYIEGNTTEGLRDFERLLVETLSCEQADMKWLVAMHEGLFPLVRDIATSRFLLTHEGSTQQGKTTGAQRFNILHGLGDVIGDGSVAALNNQKDVGLLVLDNKEQKNLTQPLIDYCLFLSTGARRLRSIRTGPRPGRPISFVPSVS